MALRGVIAGLFHPSTAPELLAGIRLLLEVPRFLGNPLTIPEARSILRERFANRQSDFLNLVRRAIYAFPARPYARMLQTAGCEYGDLSQLVVQEGVEGALRVLFRRGVYLTVEEFKGRLPTVRGSTTLHVEPTHLLNPLGRRGAYVRTSGSRGRETPVPLDLPSQRDRAVNVWLALSARNGVDWTHGVWAVPGSAGAGKLLAYSATGTPPARWFSQVDPFAQGLHPRYVWSGRILRWGSLLGRTPLPTVQHVSVEDPSLIANWMQQVLQDGRVPHLYTFCSAAARLASSALAEDIDIAGAQLTVSGEPLTDARVAAIHRSGAHVVPNYGSAELGVVSEGCLAPNAADDVHLYHDLNAVIQAGTGSNTPLPPAALLASTLRGTSPFVFINFSPGDQAVLEERSCGCPMEELGWRTHLRHIRSFEKLTAGGMTFLDTDVVRVLEETLPGRFGGGPTDYQLVDDESSDGNPHLRLLVHPRVGLIDEAEVAEAFIRAIGPGAGAQRVMSLMWLSGGFVQVERRAPLVTGGKILHLHRFPLTS